MLSSSVAIVTGVARGIGQATAVKLAQHGAKVACVDVISCDETLSLIKDGGKAESFTCDIASPSEIKDLVLNVEKKMQQPANLLVNCAGVTRDGWLWKQSEEDWDTVLNINLKGPFLLTQSVSKRILAYQKEKNTILNGSIVNISSIIGKVGNLGQPNYAASKSGLIGLTKSSAKDLAKSRIRVNAILPGFIETPMSEAVPDKVLGKFKEMIPLGHFGEPGDIAETAAFLCSPNSKYITGASIEVTGGLYM